MKKRKRTLEELTEKMRAWNRQVAPGSESNAWQDYVNDSFEIIGMPPWDDRAHKTIVPREFWDYWSEVARGESDDYDAHGWRLE